MSIASGAQAARGDIARDMDQYARMAALDSFRIAKEMFVEIDIPTGRFVNSELLRTEYTIYR